MTSPAGWLLAAALTLLSVSGAQALCIYRGELDARTTVAQEYDDSRWVVRARVVSAVDNWTNGSLRDGEEPWTLYRVRIVERFKGDPPVEVDVFTYRNSGGFYMDRAAVGPDVGNDYLLFLNPASRMADAGATDRGATIVNYNCGQSKPWAEVPEDVRGELRRWRPAWDALNASPRPARP